MVSLEERIAELCKGSMLMSPIWLARLVEEIFDATWVKRHINGTALSSENNQWPLLNSATLLGTTSPWTAVTSSKSESNTVLRFLSPQGPLFSALRQSADAWVSVSFDSKLAQSDCVRVATGIATIMRQPKVAPPDMPYRPQSRNFDSHSGSDSNCMITLPVPHYFILRLVAYLMIPDVVETLNRLSPDVNLGFYQQISSLNVQKMNDLAIPACTYSSLLDDYCDYLLTNARQPPGTTLVTSRSLCADLARLYIQAVADFWLLPYAYPFDSTTLSFPSNVSMPPVLLLQFIRRFLKRYFYNVADEWCGLSTTTVRQTTFTSLKQPLFAFLHSCATHWPLNTSFGHVVSCWRAVALPWHAVKSFNTTTNSTKLNVWESYVTENVIFYSEQLLVPLVMHLIRANVACPAYAHAVLRLAKVFGGASDTDELLQILLRLSSTTTCNQTTWNSSYIPSTPGIISAYSRNKQVQFTFASQNMTSSVKQLLAFIDATLISNASSCSTATRELLRNAKLLLNDAFFGKTNVLFEDSTAAFNDSLNKTPLCTTPAADKSYRDSAGGSIPKFRHVPVRQQSFTSFAKGDDKLLAGEPDFRSSDIPVILRMQYLFANFVETRRLLPKSGRVGAVYQAARFRWMADRRELGVLAFFLTLSYALFSSPVFFFLSMIYLTIRTFLAAIVTHMEVLFFGNDVNVYRQQPLDEGGKWESG